MPNWCSGNLVIRADEKTVEKILTAVQGENTPFDFEKVIPLDSPLSDVPFLEIVYAMLIMAYVLFLPIDLAQFWNTLKYI